MEAGRQHNTQQESDLLLKYKLTGNLELLGSLYEPYMPLVYGLCLKYLKDEAKSEDAVMQIFEQLAKKLRVHTVHHFKSWLYSLAKNHCLMSLRQTEKDRQLFTSSEIVENVAVLHQDTGDNLLEEQFVIMEKCLDRLNVEQKACVTLFYLEQKCYREICEITGFELKKVKSYIQNGKRNLKICMEKENHG